MGQILRPNQEEVAVVSRKGASASMKLFGNKNALTILQSQMIVRRQVLT
jgi:hypothetical protein